MLILTSPAKTLDFEKPFQAPFETQPAFLKQASELMDILKNASKPQLEKIMNVSSEIAQINFDRFKKWNIKHTPDNSRPAIVAYSGQIYQRIHENEYSEQQASYLQESLRIISGLYGILRPYDYIQPYRLEMNAALENPSGENLYSFWGDKLTEFLNQEITHREEKYIVNLASEEYGKSIHQKDLKAEVIHVVFNQQKKGKIHNFGLMARQARGMMIDYMVKNRIYEVKQLESFDYEGYKFMTRTGNAILFMKDMA
jgi:cytoplasmic iron level regulating protein YaaA (DUF328/UPF0246 family)